jgi:secreted trypsin-like serine protease
MRKLPVPVALVSILAAGCTYPEDPSVFGQETRAIINGAQDLHHPEVGLLYLQGQPACTATLIGSRTVLTAAHCVTNDKKAPFTTIQAVSFKVGGVMYMASQVNMHEGYRYSSGRWVADVAVVRLGQPVQDIAPAQVTKTPPVQGETVTLVGFGYTSDNAASSFGVKRKAQNTIGQVSGNLITFHGATGSVGNICFGDSGGPAFAVRDGVEYVIGVHSFGEGACGVAEHDQRVDYYHGWIAQHAQGDLYSGVSEDTSPPSVKFLTPSDNAQTAPTFQAQVAAQDDVVVSRVELFVDGAQVQQKTQPPYNFTVQSLPAGIHDLRAEAVDGAGHRVSSFVRVKVRSDLPTQIEETNTSVVRPEGSDGGALLGSCSFGGSAAPCAAAPWLILGLLALFGRRRPRR